MKKILQIFKKNADNYTIGIILITVILFLVVFITTTSTGSKDPELTDQQGQELTVETVDAAEKSAAEAQAKATAEAKATEETSIEGSAENLQTSSNNSTFPNYLLLIILALISLISILISLWLYYWRKSISEGREIMVPERFEKNINTIKSSTEDASSNIVKAINRQINTLDQTKASSDKLIEKIYNMTETISFFQNKLEQTDEEIKRYKEGYDEKIFHTFLLRFTKVDKVLKEYINKGKIDLVGLDDIHIQMEDALEECGVESYSPEIGTSYKTLDGIADNPERIPTTDKNQHQKIAEISQSGYRRRREDSSFEIITQAKVVIYEYSDPKQTEESVEETDSVDETSLKE